MVKNKVKINVENLNLWFADLPALKSANLQVFENEILGVIGPSNSGKSSLLRSFNRLNDLSPHFKIQGTITLDGKNIYRDIEIGNLRKRVGMVFALPVPLPLSIFENVIYGPRRHGVTDKRVLNELVETTLKEAYLWDEVKDRLHSSGMRLSGGQQQRLCLARTLAVNPDIILYDEPCSGLDPISTAKIEEAMLRFKNKYTQVLVTNNTKQAARVSNRTAFFLMGELVEIDRTDKIFTNPADKRTNDYISGRFG
jgi:phosphate transport system ATP-binding protein